MPEQEDIRSKQIGIQLWGKLASKSQDDNGAFRWRWVEDERNPGHPSPWFDGYPGGMVTQQRGWEIQRLIPLSEEDVVTIDTLLEREWLSHTQVDDAVRKHLDKIADLRQRLKAAK